MLIDGIYVNHKETVTGLLSVTTPVIPSGLFQCSTNLQAAIKTSRPSALHLFIHTYLHTKSGL